MGGGSPPYRFYMLLNNDYNKMADDFQKQMLSKLIQIQNMINECVNSFPKQEQPPQIPETKSQQNMTQLTHSSSSSSLSGQSGQSVKKKCIHIITKKDKTPVPCNVTVSAKSISGNYCTKHLSDEGISTTKRKKMQQTTLTTNNKPEESKKEKKEDNSVQSVKFKKMAISLIKENGKSVHKETGFVFDDEMNVIGINTDSGIAELSNRDITICKSYGFKYILPSRISRVDEVPENKENDAVETNFSAIKTQFETSSNYDIKEEEDEDEDE